MIYVMPERKQQKGFAAHPIAINGFKHQRTSEWGIVYNQRLGV
jgi:hypothetical protein